MTNDDVLSHDLVHGELLIGDPSGRRVLLGGYVKLHRASTLPHGEVVAFVRARKLAGKGIGWIDAHLLASTVVEHARLWTADRDLAAVADTLGVAHVPLS